MEDKHLPEFPYALPANALLLRVKINAGSFFASRIYFYLERFKKMDFYSRLYDGICYNN
ncbi:hypothetical protein QOZ98_002883 [Planomicrobium stackebrandtii]|uniref:Uncharacterized protein n=1 Tax=Planomicrobium stackebrandtii TaxID=253160 RepID=A0ABU0GXH5_9BACL|nr:hypothetical protein [Planomicrobium stackebrandtii]